MDAQLILDSGNQKGRATSLAEGVYLVGRSSECQIRPKNKMVSRKHCAIIHKPDRVLLKDLGSKHGTYLNREKIDPTQPVLVDDGDVLQVGMAIFRFSLELAEVEEQIQIEDGFLDDSDDESLSVLDFGDSDVGEVPDLDAPGRRPAAKSSGSPEYESDDADLQLVDSDDEMALDFESDAQDDDMELVTGLVTDESASPVTAEPARDQTVESASSDPTEISTKKQAPTADSDADLAALLDSDDEHPVATEVAGAETETPAAETPAAVAPASPAAKQPQAADSDEDLAALLDSDDEHPVATEVAGAETETPAAETPAAVAPASPAAKQPQAADSDEDLAALLDSDDEQVIASEKVEQTVQSSTQKRTEHPTPRATDADSDEDLAGLLDSVEDPADAAEPIKAPTISAKEPSEAHQSDHVAQATEAPTKKQRRKKRKSDREKEPGKSKRKKAPKNSGTQEKKRKPGEHVGRKGSSKSSPSKPPQTSPAGVNSEAISDASDDAFVDLDSVDDFSLQRELSAEVVRKIVGGSSADKSDVNGGSSALAEPSPNGKVAEESYRNTGERALDFLEEPGETINRANSPLELDDQPDSADEEGDDEGNVEFAAPLSAEALDPNSKLPAYQLRQDWDFQGVNTFIEKQELTSPKKPREQPKRKFKPKDKKKARELEKAEQELDERRQKILGKSTAKTSPWVEWLNSEGVRPWALGIAIVAFSAWVVWNLYLLYSFDG